jgi:hypothetical protein
MMTWKFPAARELAALFTILAVVATGFGVTSASAQSTRLKYNRDGAISYGSRGPNVVIQQGPHTRVYITKRSWLDAGTEVLPGDRKFTDYAFPPGVSFARENNNRPIDRQPLNPPSDMGGFYPQTFPLY